MLTIARPEEDLDALAIEINECHSHVIAAVRTSLEHARECGERLSNAKAQLRHGSWLDWLHANITFSDRTAQNYVRVFKSWEMLAEKTQETADLTIEQALELLTEPRTKELDDDIDLQDPAEIHTESEAAHLVPVIDGGREILPWIEVNEDPQNTGLSETQSNVAATGYRLEFEFESFVSTDIDRVRQAMECSEASSNAAGTSFWITGSAEQIGALLTALGGIIGSLESSVVLTVRGAQ